MQAATQVMLFFGPRREHEPEETFEEVMMRRACIQTVIEVGFMRALSIPIGPNRTVNCWGQDHDNLTSHGWNVYVAPHNDLETTGYDAAAIEGRLLLRLAEAEAQLENFDMASVYGGWLGGWGLAPRA